MTLREIAIPAKVSIATVSRAINRVPSVNPVLAGRAQKIIEKMGTIRTPTPARWFAVTVVVLASNRKRRNWFESA
jgi:DNA-binding LacI/PurR family transcriptional regulator